LQETNPDPQQLLEKWRKVGDCLSLNLDASGIGGLKGSCKSLFTLEMVFASVLEPDLLPIGLGVPGDTIRQFDLSSTKLAQSKASSGQEGTADTTVEHEAIRKTHDDGKADDNVRVRVNLLNNLMNLAGELVLGRNQLIRSLTRPFRESADSEKIITGIIELVQKSLQNTTTAGGSDDRRAKAEAELQIIRKQIRELFNFRLTDFQGINSIVQNLNMVTSLIQENIISPDTGKIKSKHDCIISFNKREESL
jgi:chemotaxis protein histidine kinase CheA